MKSCSPLHAKVLRKDENWLKRYIEQEGDLELRDMVCLYIFSHELETF